MQKKTNTTLLWRILLIISMGPSGAVLVLIASAILIESPPPSTTGNNMGDVILGLYYSFWGLVGFSIVAPILAFCLQGKVLRNASLIIVSPLVLVSLFALYVTYNP
ncbi:MAG: hypothetical protein KUG72_13300 [Pseudomonadales bacterium]|nr:hypothetical protein [Pseudomonadales bacterium]